MFLECFYRVNAAGRSENTPAPDPGREVFFVKFKNTDQYFFYHRRSISPLQIRNGYLSGIPKNGNRFCPGKHGERSRYDNSRRFFGSLPSSPRGSTVSRGFSLRCFRVFCRPIFRFSFPLRENTESSKIPKIPFSLFWKDGRNRFFFLTSTAI